MITPTVIIVVLANPTNGRNTVLTNICAAGQRIQVANLITSLNTFYCFACMCL